MPVDNGERIYKQDSERYQRYHAALAKFAAIETPSADDYKAFADEMVFCANDATNEEDKKVYRALAYANYRLGRRMQYYHREDLI